MSEVTREWLTTGVFIVCFIIAIVLEVFWLIRKGWATPPKSVAFVMLSDTLSLCIGFFVPFVIIGTIIALAWSGGLTDVKGGDATLWAAISFAFLFPPLFLFFTKRVFLALFKIRSGREAWLYSLVVAFLSMAVSFMPPTVFFYASRMF